MDRKLVAILFSDIAGFTELTAGDEEKAVDLINQQRELFQPIVAEFDGEWLKEIGDGLLLSFTSSKKAINCAIKLQEKTKNIQNLDIRIGIHQGDVIISDNDVLGDDVNIASRIEPISAVGGIAVSEKVIMDLMSSPEYSFKFLGMPELKGVKQKVKVFSLSSHSMAVPKVKFSVQDTVNIRKTSSTVLSVLTTIVFTLIIFYSYPYVMFLFQTDQYSTLKIDSIDIDTQKENEERSMLTALRYGIEKKIIDNGQINLITTNQSQASLSINQSRYLSLNTIIKENEKNVKVSFILKKPDGTIYDQYYKKYTNINLSIIISTLIDLIPAWALNTMINNGENETSINEENIQFQYPMDYYELLGILNSQETNNIQDAIIKLEELDITDEAKWIDLMMAEAYTKGFMNNKSERFLNAAENILMQNQFLESNNKAYESYIRSLISYSKEDIDQALVNIKQAIKTDQSEKRYRVFHHKIRSIKLNRMTTNG
ncbi:uncharacterized protein METZ01_LOCUS112747 [marine metagenome]|uniref:Guanylate cyclase domain-containing protein n=1 Tax=marine metagenome TaxID=408172 RepID=A0A381X6N7_9ZZZZ